MKESLNKYGQQFHQYNNIIKKNNHLSHQTIEHKKTMTYCNPALGEWQAQKSGGVKPFPSDNWISNDNTDIIIQYKYLNRVMVFNATINNISVISWWSVLLVEETRVPRENHRPAASRWQTLSYNVVSIIPLHEQDSNSQL